MLVCLVITPLLKFISVLKVFFLILITFFLLSCDKKTNNDKIVYARVDNIYLSEDNLDSVFFFETVNKTNLPLLIERWVEKTILLKSSQNSGFDKDVALIKKRDEFFNQLIISAFVETETNKLIKIKKEEVKKYFTENKEMFYRKEDGVLVEHYLIENEKDATYLKKVLFSDTNDDKINLIPFKRTTDYIKKGRLAPDIDLLLFNKKNRVVGPIKTKPGYSVFKIIKKYKKGSEKGLEEVYDEIYQRLYKTKYVKAQSVVLDSVKKEMSLYINPKYQ